MMVVDGVLYALYQSIIHINISQDWLILWPASITSGCENFQTGHTVTAPLHGDTGMVLISDAQMNVNVLSNCIAASIPVGWLAVRGLSCGRFTQSNVKSQLMALLF
jgi:hypothetical protein